MGAVIGQRLTRVVAPIAGELAPSGVPVAAGVDLRALLAGDSDPLQIVAAVSVGKSKRGWRYTRAALDQIVRVVNGEGLAGFLGHQKAEDVEHSFPVPVLHWIGATWQGETALFRGVVDADAPSVKRWLRARRITQVSVFGQPKLEQLAGETVVTGYRPLSIDLVPLGRAGMETTISVMAGGEMDALGEGVASETSAQGEPAVPPGLRERRVAF